MKRNLLICTFTSLTMLIAVAGCTKSSSESESASADAGAETPSFSLSWSEYPSWSVFGVAGELGLIDGKKV